MKEQLRPFLFALLVPALALVTVSTAPAVMAGVALMLWLTGTTLNIQSFIGSIMAIGVAGLIANPAATPAALIRTTRSRGSGTASR